MPIHVTRHGRETGEQRRGLSIGASILVETRLSLLILSRQTEGCQERLAP